ncbi:mechanosensitive ion channel family protein [Azospirillum thermophilum]|uniref:Small-conductance mechanosensitive channel n=1 Tax=Azospirillum thermophilum TaxID=2202148 RepID=A0A2S2CQX4_9PROT|nr:mechanosensitive ion channel family protein [Azospirillum thermophilum]AWK86924.1 transmembrane transporter [Azospirillum thermophilum]
MTLRPLLAALNKLLMPLGGCILLGGALYLEGSAYQAAGVEALESGWRVLGYGLSIGLVLSLAVLLRRLVQVVVLDGLVASALGGPVPRLLSQLSGLLIYLMAVAAIAGFVFKQDLTVLWAASGVAGVVLGMALRELLVDIFTGLALNLDRPLRIGDHIRLHKAGDITIEGRVAEISWRSTRLKDDFGNIITVPNSRIAASTITNHSLPTPYLEFMVTLTLDVGVPAERALRILEAAAVEAMLPFAAPGVDAPYVRIRAVTPTGVEYGVFFCPPVEKRFRARSLVLQRILSHLDHAGLRPAWPKEERAPGDPDSAVWRSVGAERLALLLGAADPLSALDHADVALLAAGVRQRCLPPGSTLVQAGESAAAAYLVIEGLLSAEPARGRGAATEPVAVGPGRLVGLDALFLGGAHGATVRSRTEALVGEITMEAMRRLLEQRPETAAPLARAVAGALARGGEGRAAETADLAADILSNLRRSTGIAGLMAAD